MAASSDTLHLIPELTAIGRKKLQVYCDKWWKRPIAREFGIAQIIVDEELMLAVYLNPDRVEVVDDEAIIPIDELLGYIIDQHVADADERRRLHFNTRHARQRWAELGTVYDATLGRGGLLYITFTCKNPDCRAIMQTDQQACENQKITYGPTHIECLA